MSNTEWITIINKDSAESEMLELTQRYLSLSFPQTL